MADRYSEDRFFGPEDQYQVRGAPPARNSGYSSARDYAAAGIDMDRGSDRGRDRDFGGNDYGRSGRDDYRERSDRDYGRADYGRSDRDRSEQSRSDQARGDYSRSEGSRERDSGDRGFFERAGDEVRAWFGDEEAERRRARDMRDEPRSARAHDDHYSAWRRERIEELDRDYEEYRRENAQRFHNEFSSWRSERQGQRDSLGRVAEHMEVVGSDGSHVGTVDKVRGDRVVLTKTDTDAGGHHHSIPSRWIDSVSDKVTLRKTADEAKAAWKDEERSAMFGEERGDRNDWRGDHNLNRSFKGTY